MRPKVLRPAVLWPDVLQPQPPCYCRPGPGSPAPQKPTPASTPAQAVPPTPLNMAHPACPYRHPTFIESDDKARMAEGVVDDAASSTLHTGMAPGAKRTDTSIPLSQRDAQRGDLWPGLLPWSTGDRSRLRHTPAVELQRCSSREDRWRGRYRCSCGHQEVGQTVVRPHGHGLVLLLPALARNGRSWSGSARGPHACCQDCGRYWPGRAAPLHGERYVGHLHDALRRRRHGPRRCAG